MIGVKILVTKCSYLEGLENYHLFVEYRWCKNICKCVNNNSNNNASNVYYIHILFSFVYRTKFYVPPTYLNLLIKRSKFKN